MKAQPVLFQVTKIAVEDIAGVIKYAITIRNETTSSFTEFEAEVPVETPFFRFFAASLFAQVGAYLEDADVRDLEPFMPEAARAFLREHAPKLFPKAMKKKPMKRRQP